MPRTSYENPIIPGFNPDPSVCRVGEDYYLVTSSFEFFPGVPIYRSRDLVHWLLIGHCLTRASQLPLEGAPCSGGIWAPTIRYHDGLFYMVSTNLSSGGIFWVTAEDPAGEWSEPVRIAQGGIDPSLFFDEDGKAYLASTGSRDGVPGIIQSEIDSRSGELLSQPRFIWAGTGGQCPEGPHLYKIDGTYYLLIAEGGTHYGHMATIARSASPWGPFEGCPRNPILSHRDRNGHPIQGTGHADLVRAADGSWWAVFLGFRVSKKYFHHLGRETFLAPVSFDAERWPLFYKDGTVETRMEADVLEPYAFPVEPARDDFDGPLRKCWSFLRNPRPGSWSLAEAPGSLTLHGNEVSLDDVGSPAFVCRRQEHFDCEVRALLEFEPRWPNEEAGLALYYSNEQHYDFFVSTSVEGRILSLRRVVGDMKYIAARQRIEEGPIVLGILAETLEYRFLFSQGRDGRNMSELGRARTQFLSTEAGNNGFVGTFVGMYSSGNGRACGAPARFDWFEYRALTEREGD
jgi:Beta-xylosidase